MSTFYTISSIITMISSFVLGVFVYLKAPRNITNRAWFLMSISVAIWSAGFCAMVSGVFTKEMTLFLDRISHVGAIFIPVFYLYFILALLDKIKEYGKIINIGYLLAAFLLVFVFSRWFIIDMAPKQLFKYYPVPGPVYPFFTLMFFTFISFAQYLMIKNFRSLSGIVKNQIKYVFIASTLGFVGGATTFPLVYDIPIPPVGGPLVFIYTVVISYAIVRYRLMDIRVAATRAGIFTFVYLIVLGIPFVLGYGLLGKGLWYIPLFIGIVLASGGPFLYTIMRRRAESRLRREEFKAHQALNRLSQNMMRVTKLDTLLKLIVHYVVKIMRVDFATIYLKDEGSNHYHLRATRSINKTPAEQSEFQEGSSLVKDILLRRVPIVAEELSFGRTSKISSHLKKLQLELYRSKAAVVIPAFKGDYLFGFLLLGARENNRLFTQEDLNLLLLLANQSVLAIENAQLFEKEKVLLAEKSRRDALADMAPGVAHQFNNRLISISMVADTQFALNEQEDLKKFSPDKLISLIEQSQKAFESISKDAIRGKDIADAILKKGKAKLTYIKTDLAPIIQTAIELLKVSRTRKSLEGAQEPDVVLNAEDNLPQLILNESLIQDIFYNIIDNARDAIIIMHKAIEENRITPDQIPYQGKITIAVRREDKQVIVTVQDNGIGMDEKTKARLFVPYFTTKATSLKGTGMGLWVIRSFIEDHKGKISFESEYGKGTTFTITFPIKEAKS